MSRRTNRFTTYDALEASGFFELNPANQDSKSKTGEALYQGPVEFPKMLFHPTGETEVLVRGEDEMTPRGVRHVNEQRQIIHAIANNAAEEKRLVAAGWHHSAAKAMGKDAPAETPAGRIAALEAEVARLQREASAPPPAISDADRLLGAGDLAD